MRVTPKASFFGLLGALAMVTAIVVFMLYWSKSQLDNRSAAIEEKRVQAAELDAKTDAAISLREELDEKQGRVRIDSHLLAFAGIDRDVVVVGVGRYWRLMAK